MGRGDMNLLPLHLQPCRTILCPAFRVELRRRLNVAAAVGTDILSFQLLARRPSVGSEHDVGNPEAVRLLSVLAQPAGGHEEEGADG